MVSQKKITAMRAFNEVEDSYLILMRSFTELLEAIGHTDFSNIKGAVKEYLDGCRQNLDSFENLKDIAYNQLGDEDKEVFLERQSAEWNRNSGASFVEIYQSLKPEHQSAIFQVFEGITLIDETDGCLNYAIGVEFQDEHNGYIKDALIEFRNKYAKIKGS